MTILEDWKLNTPPQPFALQNREVDYAVVIVIAGDGSLTFDVLPDIVEMKLGVTSDISVLLLVDRHDEGTFVMEVLPSSSQRIEEFPEICTGDPRPLADFFARALVSYSKKTRFALGLWGHGSGVFGDLDDDEKLLPVDFNKLPLGTEINAKTWVELGPCELPPHMELLETLLKKQPASRSFLPDTTSNGKLTNLELSSSLLVAFSRARRREPVDMVFFDTCLGGSVEVFTQLRRFSRTFVASALPIPGTGWDYQLWLESTGKERPEDARSWAELAVKCYEKTYDPRVSDRTAQIAAWDTSVDFIESFGRLPKCLIQEKGVEGVAEVFRAASECESIRRSSNIDLGQLLSALKERSSNERIKDLCKETLSLYKQARIALSLAPAYKENLTGMTIWCPLRGDPERVGCYYYWLEFNQLTLWWEFLITLALMAHTSPPLLVSAYQNLELIEAIPVEEFSYEEGEVLFLSVMPECSELAGGLESGRYHFERYPGQMELKNPVGLRELVELVLEIDAEFEPLRDCWKGGKVLGAEVCEVLFELFILHNDAIIIRVYSSSFFLRMKSLMKAARSGALVFH